MKIVVAEWYHVVVFVHKKYPAAGFVRRGSLPFSAPSQSYGSYCHFLTSAGDCSGNIYVALLFVGLRKGC